MADELGRLAESAPRHSLAVAVSDFYVAPDGLRPQLAALAAREVRCLLLRVLDPAETALEWRDPVVAVDLETGVELEVRPDELRDDYAAAFAAHRAALKLAAVSTRAELVEVSTAADPFAELSRALAVSGGTDL